MVSNSNIEYMLRQLQKKEMSPTNIHRAMDILRREFTNQLIQQDLIIASQRKTNVKLVQQVSELNYQIRETEENLTEASDEINSLHSIIEGSNEEFTMLSNRYIEIATQNAELRLQIQNHGWSATIRNQRVRTLPRHLEPFTRSTRRRLFATPESSEDSSVPDSEELLE